MSEPSSTASSSPAPKRWPIYLILMAMVLVPYTFWKMTWFGEELSDSEIAEYAGSKDKPRRAQHALVQISHRIHEDMASAKKLYPLVLKMAAHDQFKIRSTAAWVMGQDNREDPFHESLLTLLGDPQALVRYNAALSLANFGEPLALPTLRKMLLPLTFISPHAGKVVDVLKRDDPVVAETQIALIENKTGQEIKLYSPIEGKIEELLLKTNDVVSVGDSVCTIAPSTNQLWETLRALYLIGTKEDLSRVELFGKLSGKYSEQIRVQAQMTAEAIRTKN